MNIRKLHRAARAVKRVRREQTKRQEAWSQFCSARADFLSSISDINNEFGTNYTHEDIFRKVQ